MNDCRTVLIVDDEKDHADGLAEAIEKVCGKATAVYDGRDAIKAIGKKHFDVVVSDLNLGGDINGIDVLNEVKKSDPSTEVILITAYATIETCKDAIRSGAFDYLTKPIDVDKLRQLVKSALQKTASEKPIAVTAKRRPRDDFHFEGVIGQSPAVHNIMSVLRKVSPTNITVLIEGESGTGKELLARAIHDNSLRKDNPFKPINCAGLTETLLESELFGHSKGAFTGALEARKGLFEAADKGTLFLDEIGDMPLSMQAKLLRVLEDGIITPVGSNKSVVVDVRVISATNHDLAKLVEQKKFRQDLYFRIKGVSITLPPLRSRTEDIAGLTDYFIAAANQETGKNIKGLSDSALAVLQSYHWPGNIRQLRDCIRIMVVMAEGDVLSVRDIPADIHQLRQLTGGAGIIAGVKLNELEKQAIIEALKNSDGNREKAAKQLGIGERTLYRKIKEYGL